MHRILLIDDHQDILEANRSYFAEQGFAAIACGSGSRRFPCCKQEPLIVLSST